MEKFLQTKISDLTVIQVVSILIGSSIGIFISKLLLIVIYKYLGWT